MSDSECSLPVRKDDDENEDQEVSIASKTLGDEKLEEFEKLLQAIMESRCPSPNDDEKRSEGT